MPERFKVVCIPCKALYKCSAFTFTLQNEKIAILIHHDAGTNIAIEYKPIK